MAETVRSKRLVELAHELDRLNEERKGEGVCDAISAVLFPEDQEEKDRRHTWVADNDWQSQSDFGTDALRDGLRIASNLRDGESVFEVDLAFGGDLQADSTLFLSGTEDDVAALLQGLIDALS